MNVIEIEERIEQIAKEGFKSADFIFDFIAAYDAPKAVLKQLRQGQQNPSEIGGILWRRYMHYKGASRGAVSTTIDELHNAKENAKHKVRYIISTDGDEFAARDLKSGDTLNCDFSKLGDHFGFFLPLANIERYKIADENPVDIKATGRLAKFYDSILEDNPSWSGDEKRHTLNHFMTQIVFCLFAEDTGIFPQGIFSETLKTYCENDTSLTQSVVTNVFRAMSLPEADRAELPVYAKRFPYVNGGLFNEVIAVPRFLRGSLRYLLDAAMLNWREINPDIFGSMIQSIVNQDQRGELGLHYTSVPNILKVLDPLLLDELRQQAKDYWHNRKALRQLLERLSNIRIFDPACGSGNFLVIAYRELRNIEMTIVTRLAVLDNVPAPLWSNVSLRNFFGIEYTDFAAETAKLSLWIAEYQLNSVYEAEFGKRQPALPISSSANIVCYNALTTNWFSVCPPTTDARVETFIVGNPPYLGSVQQSAEQKSDMKAIFEGRTRLFKDLDYVSCWFVLATDYIKLAQCKSAFVATNSICQGEQVDMLWPILLNSGAEIAFAHTAFKWRNNAADNAGVSCVIIGLRKAGAHGTTTLFDSEIARRVSNINPYLLAAPNIIVKKRTESICDAPRMHKGCQPSDGGNLILSENECEFLRREHPEHSDLIREFVGSLEFIRGSMRWCLWIPDERVPELRKLKFFAHRFDKIAELRKTGGTQAQEYADIPHKFVFSAHRDSYNIIVPRVFSENREFLTVGLVDGRKTVVSDNAMVLYAADTSYFSILSSRMHICWIRTVCGQLESRIRYSNTLGWNTFPIPPLTDVEKASLKQSAENILLAREGYFDKTIADLYDPDRMVHEFADLLNAHRENDELVEKIYIGRTFRSDAERLEHLFSRYSEMVEAE